MVPQCRPTRQAARTRGAAGMTGADPATVHGAGVLHDNIIAVFGDGSERLDTSRGIAFAGFSGKPDNAPGC